MDKALQKQKLRSETWVVLRQAAEYGGVAEWDYVRGGSASRRILLHGHALVDTRDGRSKAIGHASRDTKVEPAPHDGDRYEVLWIFLGPLAIHAC